MIEAMSDLHELRLTGAVVVDRDILHGIVDRCPDLECLVVDVAYAEAPEVLTQLAYLKECCLSTEDVSDLDFVANLANLESLYLWLELEIEQELVLPPKLRELRCYSDEYDNSKFMIKINGTTDAALEVVELPARSLLACPEALLTNVRGLAWWRPRKSTTSDDWTWLQTFPCLTELEVGLKRDGTVDARYLEAFKMCPRLDSLVDRSDDHVYHATCPLPASIIERAQYSFEDKVTVGRAQEGRLIKRCGGSTSELVNTSSNLV